MIVNIYEHNDIKYWQLNITLLVHWNDLIKMCVHIKEPAS